MKLSKKALIVAWCLTTQVNAQVTSLQQNVQLHTHWALQSYSPTIPPTYRPPGMTQEHYQSQLLNWVLSEQRKRDQEASRKQQENNKRYWESQRKHDQLSFQRFEIPNNSLGHNEWNLFNFDSKNTRDWLWLWIIISDSSRWEGGEIVGFTRANQYFSLWDIIIKIWDTTIKNASQAVLRLRSLPRFGQTELLYVDVNWQLFKLTFNNSVLYR